MQVLQISSEMKRILSEMFSLASNISCPSKKDKMAESQCEAKLMHVMSKFLEII